VCVLAVLSDLTCLDRLPSYLGYSQISQWIDSLGGSLRAERFAAIGSVATRASPL
jgi:hypothetical protein